MGIIVFHLSSPKIAQPWPRKLLNAILEKKLCTSFWTFLGWKTVTISHTLHSQKTMKPLPVISIGLEVLLATGNLIFVIFTSGHRNQIDERSHVGPFFPSFLVWCLLVGVCLGPSRNMLDGESVRTSWEETGTYDPKTDYDGKAKPVNHSRVQICGVKSFDRTSAEKWHFSSMRRM